MRIATWRHMRHTRHTTTHRRWPRLAALAMLGALALAGLLSASLIQSPQTLAAGSDPIIHWDESMIYPGQNNGNPWGPVGENALVHGEKFTASGILGQPITLALIKGDVNNPPGGGSYEFCKLAGPKIPLPGQAQVDSTGAFTYNFVWPPAASSGTYSICAYNTLDGLPVGNIDDGPFTALVGNAPSVSVSSASVAGGQSITVTGKNWVPPQDVNVYIAACVDCDGPIVVAGTAHSSGLNTGTFSITFPIPANATPGNFVAGANAHNGILDVGPGGGKPVTIVAAQPTAAPTDTPAQPTATSATRGSEDGNNGSSSGSEQSGVSPLVLALVGGGALLLVIALLVILMVALSRRGAKKTPPGGSSELPGGHGPGPYSGDGGAPVAPGGGTVLQNWETLPPGWGDQTPPTVARGLPGTAGMPPGDDSPTRANYSHIADPAYPPAPPAMYPPPAGDTPTQPGQYGAAPPNPYGPYDPYGG